MPLTVSFKSDICFHDAPPSLDCEPWCERIYTAREIRVTNLVDGEISRRVRSGGDNVSIFQFGEPECPHNKSTCSPLKRGPMG
jgi:hypothetical protein